MLCRVIEEKYVLEDQMIKFCSNPSLKAPNLYLVVGLILVVLINVTTWCSNSNPFHLHSGNANRTMVLVKVGNDIITCFLHVHVKSLVVMLEKLLEIPYIIYNNYP
jgi:hypothetical protein